MCCLFGLIEYKGTLTGKQKSKMVSLLGTAMEEIEDFLYVGHYTSQKRMGCEP